MADPGSVPRALRAEGAGATLAVGGGAIALTVGDLSAFTADALVNAANSGLRGGGGVDGALHRVGGPEILAETQRRYPAGCPTGSAVITGAGNLPARWLIHAVGPVWQGGGRGEPELLASAYREALRLADEAGARTVGLPAISAGIYGYPLSQAAAVALSVTWEALAAGSRIERATFVLFSQPTYQAFAHALDALDALRDRPPPG
jgi:O-acetyl-ADP-ribose deacetylase